MKEWIRRLRRNEQFLELEPWHKVQVIIIFLLILIYLYAIWRTIKPTVIKMWRDYKKHLAELEKWEAEQQMLKERNWEREHIDFAVYDSKARIKKLGHELRKKASERGKTMKSYYEGTV